MKIRYDREDGVFIWFQKDEGEVQLAIRTLDGIARDMDDAYEADKIEHVILSIVESENSTLQ